MYRLSHLRRFSVKAATLCLVATFLTPVAYAEWAEEGRVFASDPAAISGLFGDSVAVFGDAAIIGAENSSDGSGIGAAYMFRYDGVSWSEEQRIVGSDSTNGDYFGYAVDIYGDVAVMGAYRASAPEFRSGAAYIYRFDGTNWIEEAKLVAPDGKENDNFGTSVGIFGDVVVVGTPNDNDSRVHVGSAYVFRYDGTGNWIHEKKLVASDSDELDEFGISVSVYGDTIIAGAWKNDDNADDSGSAYVFRYDGTEWWEEAKLVAADNDLGDLFGYSVSIHGGVALVGAVSDNEVHPSAGAAYVFRYDGTTWFEESKILPEYVQGLGSIGTSVAARGDRIVVSARYGPNPNGGSGTAFIYHYDCGRWVQEGAIGGAPLGEQFGHEIAISGETILVGARTNDEMGDSAGAAYFFRFEGPLTPKEAVRLTASDAAAGAQFGVDIDIDSGVLVVGTEDDELGAGTGAAYVYRYDGSDWHEEAKLTAPDFANNQLFGTAVAISGDVIAVGAYGDVTKGFRSGAVYVFRYDGFDWVFETKFTASNGSTEARFGASVDVDGDVIAVGSWASSWVAGQAGQAYAFRYDGTQWVEERILSPADLEQGDRFARTVSVSGDVIVAGSEGDDDGADGAGAAYVFRYDGVDWNEDAKLVAFDAAAFDVYGFNVAVSETSRSSRRRAMTSAEPVVDRSTRIATMAARGSWIRKFTP